MKTSATALLAGSMLLGVSAAALACGHFQKQVLAKATTPPAEEETASTAATPVDPMLLAKTETPEKTETAVEK